MVNTTPNAVSARLLCNLYDEMLTLTLVNRLQNCCSPRLPYESSLAFSVFYSVPDKHKHCCKAFCYFVGMGPFSIIHFTIRLHANLSSRGVLVFSLGWINPFPLNPFPSTTSHETSLECIQSVALSHS